MSDIRVPLDPILSAFGVPVTVTRPAPNNTPISTTGVWMTPESVDVPIGVEFQRRDQRRVMALPRSAVPTVPHRTVIVAPEKQGGASKTWVVDGTDSEDLELARVLLVLDS